MNETSNVAGVCPGTGMRWSNGTTARNPICPACHRGHRSLGLPFPTKVKGRWVGALSEHERREA